MRREWIAHIEQNSPGTLASNATIFARARGQTYHTHTPHATHTYDDSAVAVVGIALGVFFFIYLDQQVKPDQKHINTENKYKT